MAASDQYSVRCEDCESSFAPETKNCVHCGRPLGGGLMGALRSAAGELEEGGGGEAEPQPSRSWGWTAFAVMVIGFQFLRACAE